MVPSDYSNNMEIPLWLSALQSLAPNNKVLVVPTLMFIRVELQTMQLYKIRRTYLNSISELTLKPSKNRLERIQILLWSRNLAWLVDLRKVSNYKDSSKVK